MSIRLLPDEAIQQLKSSVTITSLNDAVLNLAKNSLDASATKIIISVDYSRGNCLVEDDGLGIEPDEFLERGAIGRPHRTSRCPHSEKFHGSHGNFLSSLGTLSLMSVTSQHHTQASANTVTIRNSVVLSRNVPSLPEHRLQHSGHGTRVAVRDLFGSMPVRVKQRPTASDKVAIERDFGHLVQAAVALILAWPEPVSLSLRESQGRGEIRLRPPRSPSPADLKLSTKVARILVQAGLAEEISYGTWVSVGASSGDVTVSGCMSLNAVATRRVQFLSMGIRPFSNHHGKNILYDEINRVFASSDFASADDTGNLRYRAAYVAQELKVKKRLERWPMFYLRIERSSEDEAAMSSAEDILDQPRTLSVIIDLVKTISVEFLRRHHFRSRAPADMNFLRETEVRMTSTGRQSPAVHSSSEPGSRSSTPKLRSESPFDSWQRIKVGRRVEASSKKRPIDKAADPEQPQSLKASSSPEKNPLQPLVSKSGKLLRRPFCNVEWPSSTQTTPEAASNEPPEQAANSKISTPREETLVGSNSSLTHRLPAAREPSFRCIQPDQAPSGAEPSEWLKDILASWDNPVFETTEARIPSVEGAIVGRGLGTGCAMQASADDPGAALSTIAQQGRLSKKSLSQAEVISQVDQKFVLIKTCQQSGYEDSAQDPNSSLVIVDQHAADERCQLEDLMRDYFDVDAESGHIHAKTERLAAPVRFEFSARECDMLRRFVSHFEYWGILLEAYPMTEGTQTGMVDVFSLPPSILERARSEPKLLADLLRGESWKLEDDGLPRSTRVGRDITDWVANFQGCPQGILDMLNSRSCRSAIMFNDVLSHDQCRDLIHRLSKCSFPFQCAHGRPSMAPLIDLDGFNDQSRDHTRQEEFGFGRKMREMGQEAQT